MWSSGLDHCSPALFIASKFAQWFFRQAADDRDMTLAATMSICTVRTISGLIAPISISNSTPRAHATASALLPKVCDTVGEPLHLICARQRSPRLTNVALIAW